MRSTHGYAAPAHATAHPAADDAVTAPPGGADRAAMPSSYAHCPHCGAAAGVPVVYGQPTETVGAAAARGEVVLGDRASAGDGTDADRACTRCGHRWRSDAVSRVRGPTH